MIEFKDLPIRETASIMKGQFEQVKLLYAQDPVLAGELAISMMEQALCLDYSCTNFTVQLVLKNYENLVEKKAEKYDAKKYAALEAQKDSLRPIAEMLKQGKTQVVIGKELGIARSTLSDKVRKIRTEFPELLVDPENPGESEIIQPDSIGSDDLSEFPEKTPDLIETERIPENPENPDHVNVNVNVNVNDNVSRVSSNEETLPLISRQALNQMGATYKDLGNGVIETATGKKMKLDFKYDF